jgi:hypothetical protein
MINNLLQQISCNCKDQREKGVTLSNPPFAHNIFTSRAVKEGRSGCRTKQILDPPNSFVRKAFHFKHLKHDLMFNQIKSFLKIKL